MRAYNTMMFVCLLCVLVGACTSRKEKNTLDRVPTYSTHCDLHDTENANIGRTKRNENNDSVSVLAIVSTDNLYGQDRTLTLFLENNADQPRVFPAFYAYHNMDTRRRFVSIVLFRKGRPIWEIGSSAPATELREVYFNAAMGPGQIGSGAAFRILKCKLPQLEAGTYELRGVVAIVDNLDEYVPRKLEFVKRFNVPVWPPTGSSDDKKHYEEVVGEQ